VQAPRAYKTKIMQVCKEMAYASHKIQVRKHIMYEDYIYLRIKILCQHVLKVFKQMIVNCRVEISLMSRKYLLSVNGNDKL
jgi:hypothetical protein